MVAVIGVIFLRTGKAKAQKALLKGAVSLKAESCTLRASQHLSLDSGRRLRGHVPALLGLGLPGARRAGPPELATSAPGTLETGLPAVCAPPPSCPSTISNGPACPPSQG